MIDVAPQIRQRMGRSAQWLSRQWSAAATSQQVLALYRELATGNDIHRSGTFLGTDG